jgi:hypothetical protein
MKAEKQPQTLDDIELETSNNRVILGDGSERLTGSAVR